MHCLHVDKIWPFLWASGAVGCGFGWRAEDGGKPASRDLKSLAPAQLTSPRQESSEDPTKDVSCN